MKNTPIYAFVFLLLAEFSLSAQGNIYYSLPRTGIEITVQTVKTSFQAGPYAAFAPKYLGLPAAQRDSSAYSIAGVRLRSFVEADPERRYSCIYSQKAEERLLSLTSQGLVAGEAAAFTAEAGWKFPSSGKAEFLWRPANLTSRISTLYDAGTGTAVSQRLVVEKSEEAKAAEVAERIFAIRENRYKILVGDTDASYGGEAMKATIDALDSMEKELVSLFLGVTTRDEQEASFELIPTAANPSQYYVAFRLSQEAGPVSPDDLSGTPYYLQILPESGEIHSEESYGAPSHRSIRYRVPLVCKFVLSDGINPIMQQRLPVYQFGFTEDYPITK